MSQIIKKKMIKKRRLLLFGYIFLISLHESCKTNQHLLLRKAYQDVLNFNSSFSIQADTLFTLENIKSGQDTVDQFEYRVVAIETDSMRIIKNKTIYESGNAFELSSRMINNSIFIDTIGKYKFEYDTIPNELLIQFDKSEDVVKFKSSNDFWIYCTKNHSFPILKLHVSKKNTSERTSVEIPLDAFETPDFLLYQNPKTKFPEIFFFKNLYFMRRNLFEVQVFSVTLKSK